MIDRQANVVIVSREEAGPVLPRSIQELRTSTVEVEPETTVRRGIYGRHVRMVTPFVIAGPVCAGRSVRVDLSPTEDADARILGGVIASERVVVARTRGGSRLRVVGDVAAEDVSLTGTLVVGNVLGGAARLRESIVLGHVGCAGRLDAENSVVGSFHVGHARFGAGCRLLSLAGSATGAIEFDAPVTSVALAPIETSSSTTEDLEIELSEDDIVTVDHDGREITSLDAFPRLLNLRAMKTIRHNAGRVAALAAHYYPDRVRSSPAVTLDARSFEDRLWNLLETRSP